MNITSTVSFSRERFKKRDTKPPAMIDTVCLGMLCFFFVGCFPRPKPASMISAARALIWHLFFTQEPFNLFPSLHDLYIFSPSAKPIFFIGWQDLLTGVGQVSRTKLSNMAESSVFCSVRSKVYPGFPLCFCLFRRHPLQCNIDLCVRFLALNPRGEQGAGNLKIKRARSWIGKTPRAQ